MARSKRAPSAIFLPIHLFANCPSFCPKRYAPMILIFLPPIFCHNSPLNISADCHVIAQCPTCVVDDLGKIVTACARTSNTSGLSVVSFPQDEMACDLSGPEPVRGWMSAHRFISPDETSTVSPGSRSPGRGGGDSLSTSSGRTDCCGDRRATPSA